MVKEVGYQNKVKSPVGQLNVSKATTTRGITISIAKKRIHSKWMFHLQCFFTIANIFQIAIWRCLCHKSICYYYYFVFGFPFGPTNCQIQRRLKESILNKKRTGSLCKTVSLPRLSLLKRERGFTLKQRKRDIRELFYVDLEAVSGRLFYTTESVIKFCDTK